MKTEEQLAPPFRFPVVSPATAASPLALPSFRGFPQGWYGTLDEFLAAVRQGAIGLEHAPLAAVVDQYLVHREKLGLDEAGEYLHVTASLINWKTRLLLPRDPLLEQLDPREEIVRTLAAQAHEARSEAVVVAPTATGRESRFGLSLLDLMLLWHEVEQAARRPASGAISRPEVTVADQLRWLAEWLVNLPHEAQDTAPWFQVHPSFPAKICLFLALLELCKQGRLALEQSQAFGSLMALPIEDPPSLALNGSWSDPSITQESV